jgi:hypothetical protein
MIKRVLPPLVLLFLAPAVSQMLSAELAPASFFSVFGLTVLPLIYGGGAILVRDLVRRWRKGWVGLLLLGAVYGIIREGLMLRSFFDPFWQGIETLSYYGRWAGINWVWSIERIIYHSVISVGIPVLLTEIMFPEFRNKVWLGKWVTIVLAIVFAMNIIFGYFFGTDYPAGVLQYWLTAAVAAVLFFLAWKLPGESALAKEISIKSPFFFWLTGFLGTVAFMVIFWMLPDTSTPAPLTIVLGIVLVAFVTWLVMRLSGNTGAWDDRHRLALASGPLTIFILITPIEELFRSREGSTTGMMLVGLGALILLVWLARRTIKRANDGRSG